jgi:hypothetical protein
MAPGGMRADEAAALSGRSTGIVSGLTLEHPADWRVRQATPTLTDRNHSRQRLAVQR